MSTIITLLKFLPEFVALAKTILSLVKKGKTEIQVRQALKEVDKAFKEVRHETRARMLNDIFRK